MELWRWTLEGRDNQGFSTPHLSEAEALLAVGALRPFL